MSVDTTLRRPAAVFLSAAGRTTVSEAPSTGPAAWAQGPTRIDWVAAGSDSARLVVTTSGPISTVLLRWDTPPPPDALILGDAWERSYGDLRWGHLQPDRTLPWYFLAHDRAAGSTTGMGVDVQPGAFCSWSVDADGVTLWVDLRNGTGPTVPGDRALEVATIRAFAGDDPFSTAQDACRAMAGTVAARDIGPVVGANNWYYAYGENFDEAAVLGDAAAIVELADGHPVQPFSVIDDGWNPGGASLGGPWDQGIPGLFDDLGATAGKIREIGARPGIWFRPLLTTEAGPDRRPHHDPRSWVLDPSVPGTLDLVAEDLRRFRGWGFDLVKHDFSTFDIFGRFGPAMGAELTGGDWQFADTTRTSAEIILDFYRHIRAADEDLVVIGCNTVGHLAAGLVDIQRTGDDTSGRQWERTRRMGVNTLAYRLPQHGAFFTVDADCVPCTPQTPWELNRQFLDVVARSGTALFVSLDPASRTDVVDADLRAAIRTALDGGDPSGIRPVDWLSTTTPQSWRAAGSREGESTDYRWTPAWGAEPGPA